MINLESCFFFDAVEDSYEVTGIEGRLPDWLRGSYYVNGPARFERDGRRYRHWLDGDGMVCALHFGDAGVRFVSRFVRTRKLADEEQAGAFLYRGFGTAFDGDRLRRNVMLESPMNINVLLRGRELLAFGEQSLPMRLHPETLETLGEVDFGGSLNEVTPFAAHAKLDPRSGNLLNFGISYAAERPALHLYEIGPDESLLRRRHVRLRMPHSNHDFGFTSGHAVFFLSPMTMDFERFVRDRASVMDSLTWEPERGSSILMIPRVAGGGESFSVAAGHGYCLHVINAFETGKRLVLDILELERPVYPEYQPMPHLFASAPRCSPVRYVVDLETRRLDQRIRLGYDLNSDFPAIDPKLLSAQYQDFWLLGISATGGSGTKFFDVLGHGSWAAGNVDDQYRMPTGEYLAGEPTFVENPHQPEEGFVIVQHVNTRTGKAAFLIFDAFAVHRGPVIRLPLRHRLHPLFHAGFYPSAEQAR
ncbi:MAG TPA: carotenoid oxygenase family protein [Gemmatimonadaceae bacterium]|nr:carotenoid oxygenase family protein [Gemmatimonadaceae bacterium]